MYMQYKLENKKKCWLSKHLKWLADMYRFEQVL